MAVTEAAFHLEPMAIPSLAPAEQALGHQLGLEHPMPMALAAMAAMAPEVAPAMPTGPALAMAAMAAMPMAMVPMLAVFRLVASEDVVSLLVALGDVGSPPVALEAHKLRHPPLLHLVTLRGNPLGVGRSLALRAEGSVEGRSERKNLSDLSPTTWTCDDMR